MPRRPASRNSRARPRRPVRIEPIDISPAEDGFVAYQPETDKVHYLNHSALLVLELCNGRLTTDEIASVIGKGYGLGRIPRRDITAMLDRMTAEGLIRYDLASRASAA
jgi:hypothetical protein